MSKIILLLAMASLSVQGTQFTSIVSVLKKASILKYTSWPMSKRKSASYDNQAEKLSDKILQQRTMLLKLYKHCGDCNCTASKCCECKVAKIKKKLKDTTAQTHHLPWKRAQWKDILNIEIPLPVDEVPIVNQVETLDHRSVNLIARVNNIQPYAQIIIEAEVSLDDCEESDYQVVVNTDLHRIIDLAAFKNGLLVEGVIPSLSSVKGSVNTLKVLQLPVEIGYLRVYRELSVFDKYESYEKYEEDALD